MKVLYVIDRRIGDLNKLPRRLYLNFYFRLTEFCDFFYYGPEEHKFRPDHTPIIYDSRLSISDVVKELNIDVVLTSGYQVCKHFFPGKGKLDFPLVSLQGDYYSVPQNIRESWYTSSGYTHMIARGFYKEGLPDGLETVWLPLSASDDLYTDKDSNYLAGRLNRVAFIGNRHEKMSRVYQTRHKIIEAPSQYKWFDNIGPVEETYPQMLKKYKCCVADSGGTLETFLGKHFEIMASGTALLTTPIQKEMTEILFGRGQYFFSCATDLKNLKDIAVYILSNREIVEYTTYHALTIINKHHLHKHRIVELYNILKAIVNGGEIPRKWGI